MADKINTFIKGMQPVNRCTDGMLHKQLAVTSYLLVACQQYLTV